ncbi:MAG TPA: hypothetical protein VIB80_05685 [Aquiluna sp.]
MNIDFRLEAARQQLLYALPDQSQWSGPAKNHFESRIRELLAELDSIQGGLWR